MGSKKRASPPMTQYLNRCIVLLLIPIIYGCVGIVEYMMTGLMPPLGYYYPGFMRWGCFLVTVLFFFGASFLQWSSTKLFIGVLSGWVVLFVYTSLASRQTTIHKSGSMACNYLSTGIVYFMPTIVAGLSGWLLWLAIQYVE